MPRMCFTKTGNAIWISHLDLMRALQRGFRRAGIALKHSQGFSPHPLLSIALPLSVGVGSQCELAEFELDAPQSVDLSELPSKLSRALPSGIEIVRCYEDGAKLKHLRWLEARLTLEYDNGVPPGAAEAITELLERSPLMAEKHGKNGPVLLDIAPMLQSVSLSSEANRVVLTVTVSAQNPTLNPLLIGSLIETQLPQYAPDFVRCFRLRLLDEALSPFA